MGDQHSDVVTGKLSLIVLAAISILSETDKAYISKIKRLIGQNHHNLPIYAIGDRLIDLIEKGRITFDFRYLDHLQSRRMTYKLTLPEGMLPYGRRHAQYPDEPNDWSEGPVYCINGEIITPHHPPIGGWKHSFGRPDKDIIGYYSTKED